MPDWKPEIRRRLAPLTLDPAREAALADELAQHLDDHYRELTGSGMPDAAARHAALARVDRHELLRELKPVAAPMRSQLIVLGAPNASLLAGLWQDVRYSLRVLRKNPGFSAIAVLTLALGIAANTAIFSVINTLFLHPPGITDAARLVSIRVKYDKLNLKNIGVSLPDYV